MKGEREIGQFLSKKHQPKYSNSEIKTDNTNPKDQRGLPKRTITGSSSNTYYFYLPPEYQPAPPVSSVVVLRPKSENTRVVVWLYTMFSDLNMQNES